jgi:hypothetical protein
MAQSPSNSIKYQGFLRSSHALLGAIALTFVLLCAISLSAGFMFGAYFSCVGIALIVLSVLYRYNTKGPESERGQPVVTVNNQTTQIMNVEPTQEIISIIRAVQHRHAAPIPDGIIEGTVSSLDDIRIISPEMAKVLSEQDSRPVKFDSSDLVEGSSGETHS